MPWRHLNTGWQKIHEGLRQSRTHRSTGILRWRHPPQYRRDDHKLQKTNANPSTETRVGRGAAERAIQIFNNHFTSGLYSLSIGFPLQLWCYLLHQSQISLNLLQTARSNPTKSAYEVLYGKFDYNRTPLARQGQKP